MKILTGINSYECIREPGDPKFYGIRNAAGESRFLYLLQQKLNRRKMIVMDDRGTPVHIRMQGWDGEEHLDLPKNSFIKKRMWKDGHMVDDIQQYLITKNPVMFHGKKCFVSLHNENWAINGLEKDWNNGKATITVSFLESA